MSSQNLQFVPQWLKKPSTASSPTSTAPQPSPPLSAFTNGHSQSASHSSVHGMNGLGPGGRESPSAVTGNMISYPFPNGTGGGISYVNGYSGTNGHVAYPHTNAQTNGSPTIDGYANQSANYPNGLVDPTHPHALPASNQSPTVRPFRYTKSQMLSLYDPEKVARRPLELVDLLESGGVNAGVILSERAGVPMGLIEWTEEERKLFANPVRRQPAPHSSHTTATGNALDSSQNIPPTPTFATPAPGLRGLSHRSGLSSISGTVGVPPAGSPGVIGNSTGGRGFGRGEGGAFGFGIGIGGGAGGAAAVTRGSAASGDEVSREREREKDKDRERKTSGSIPEAGLSSSENKQSSGWTAGAGLVNGAGTNGVGGGAEGKGYRGPVGALYDGMGKGAKESPRSSNTASTWRPAAMRNTPTGTSASGFDGVLGFASPSGRANQALDEQDTSYGWRERERARLDALNPSLASPQSAIPGGEKPQLGAGGGPGWGKGGRWRMAAAEREKGLEAPKSPEQELKRPTLETLVDHGSSQIRPTESMAVVPPATPVQERDRQVQIPEQLTDQTPLYDMPSSVTPSHPPTPPAIEVESVKWFYTDPAGLQQGPFTASAMQDWYSHGYFKEDLPVKREHEAEYLTLAALKESTGSVDKPFMTGPKSISTPIHPGTPPRSSIRHEPVPTPPEQHAYSPSGGKGAIQGVLDKLQLGTVPESAPAQMENVSTPQRQPSEFNGRVGPSQGSSPHDAYGPVPGYLANQAMQSPSLAQGGVRAPWEAGSFEQRGAPPLPFNAWGMAPNHMSPASPLAYPQGAPRSLFDAGVQQSSPLLARAGSYSPAQMPLPASPWGQPQPHMVQPQPYMQQPGYQPMPMYAPIPPQQYRPQPMPVPPQQWQQPSPVPAFSPPAEASPPMNGQETAKTADSQVHIQQELTPMKQERKSSLSTEATSVEPAEPSIKQILATGPEAGTTKVSSVANAEILPPAVPEPTLTPLKPVKEPLPITEVTPKADTVSIAPAVAPAAVPKVSSQVKGRTVSAAIKEEKKEQTKEAALLASLARPSTPSKPAAAWAAAEDSKAKPATGPSLRDIQEAEAKAAEVKKAAEVRMRAVSAAPATSATSSEVDLPQTISWGLTASKSVSAIAATQPSPAPVWGSSDAAPKRTLKQIQEEEQKRAAAAAQAKAAASPAAAALARGYAALAAGTAASAQQAAAGWATVGAGGKAVAPAAAATVARAKPVAAAPVAKAAPVIVKPVVKTVTLDEVPPSIDFIRWTKQALAGLKNVNMDEFIQMLLTFPVEPGATARADVLEIISDSVYANSSTLDGRRFAQEFYTKRKADAQARIAGAAAGKTPVKSTSLADIVKTQPKVANEFGGFKVVKPKGKGKK